MQVTNGILNILKLFCQCELSSSDTITNEGFLCYEDSPHFVTYRARLAGTDTDSGIAYLDKWASASQLLSAQSCPVQNESQCIMSTEMTSTLTTSVIMSTNSDSVIAVMAVMVVIAFLVISMLPARVGVLLEIKVHKGN